MKDGVVVIAGGSEGNGADVPSGADGVVESGAAEPEPEGDE